MPPPKKPTVLTIASGSWRSCLRKDEVKPKLTIPECPNIIESDIAKELYYDLGKQLFAVGLMSSLDGIRLAVLCNAYTQYRRYSFLIKEEGEISVNTSGNPCPHPLIGMRNAVWKQLYIACKEFGLSPSARAGLNINAATKPSEIEGDELFFKTGS